MVLGVLDWGIGGLFAAQRTRQREPSLDLIVLSDSGQRPYGKQSKEDLTRAVTAACLRLRFAGATHILVACHSASTVLGGVPVPALGVIDASMVPPGAATLVLGGQRTIDSDLWAAALGSRPVEQRVAQPLSAHVEAGRADSAEALADLDLILEGVPTPDCVVLACTHYLAMGAAIQARFPKALVVDPALSVVDGLELSPGSGRLTLLTSGPPATLLEAATALGLV